MNIRIEPPDERIIAEAAERLGSGRVVGMPTETVYGLAGSTFDADALELIYRMKGRPSDNPLIAHVLDIDGARSITSGWDDRCDRIAAAFWPGPMTMVLERSRDVPPVASGGRASIAVRSPRHPVSRTLLSTFGGPLSAPSANRSGSVSPTTARHVHDEFESFGDESDLLVIDGGSCDIGIESTVIDLTGGCVRILRPGSVTREMLQDVVGTVEDSTPMEQGDSPGTRSRHYATSTPIRIVGTASEIRTAASGHEQVAVITTSDAAGFEHVFRLPDDPTGYAEGMYAAMRRADGTGSELIVMECPGDGPSWRAIRDRLVRASTD
ncbi:MAG: L-threonylcarbamoyladenylate synthase [Planctomycetota bacterium]|nr:L-threonylcarbamoyladenylate synthase [Planctomycetota bacterium]